MVSAVAERNHDGTWRQQSSAIRVGSSQCVMRLSSFRNHEHKLETFLHHRVHATFYIKMSRPNIPVPSSSLARGTWLDPNSRLVACLENVDGRELQDRKI